MVKNKISKKNKTLKTKITNKNTSNFLEQNLFWIIGIVFLLIILVLALFSFDLNFFIKILSGQTISGLSSGKIIFFIISLIVFFVLAKLNTKTSAPNKIILLGLVFFISFLSLFSFLVFVEENSLKLFEYYDVVYGNTNQTFSWNSLTHIHSFKPAMFPFVKDKIFSGFDFGLEYYDYMPEWFNYIYYIGFTLIIVFSLLFLKQFLSLNIEQRFRKVFFYAGTYFLLIDSFFDSGPINHMFLAGLLCLIYILISESKQNFLLKKLGLFLLPIILIISFFTPIFLSIRSFLIFFSYNNLFTIKNNKLKFYFLLLILLIIGLSISFGTRLLSNYDYYNTNVLSGEKILINPLIIKENSFLEKIEDRGFLSLYLVDKNTSFREFLNIKNNESYLNEVMVWEKHCDFFKEKRKMKVYSPTLPKNKDYHKILTNISYKIENKNSYLLSFDSSICVRNYKTIIANYLKDEGMKKFIVSD